MAITVKHLKVSAIPDAGDDTLIEPSDWNDDHVLTGTIPVDNGGTGASTLTGYVKGNGTAAMTASATVPSTDVTGLGTMSTQNANAVAITGGTMSGVTVTGYIPTSEKAQPLGVATLDAGGKVPASQIPMQGDLNYQGTWNASTNTPTLTSSVGTKGYYYVVDVAGSTNLNGITDWNIGDWAIFNGSVWQKVDNTDAVTSVNGQVGTVVLTTTNIAEGTNEYFTTARARTSVSAGTGISYNNTTGVITNSSPSLGGDVVGPSSATDNAIARYDLTTGKLIQNSVVTVSDTGAIAGATTITNLDYLDFDTTYSAALQAGQLGWNGNDTLGLGMIGGNVVQHIGEDQFFYAKATATITKGQVIMFTGAVGASGVPTGSPATGITDGSYIMGIAAENIANNGFGLIQSFGTLRNVNTSGYADGDILWYNPAVTGGLTKVKPVAPNLKAQMAAVINGGSAGGGTILIRISAGSTLGGTDSNAQIDTPSNGQIITYDGLDGYWKNTDLTAGTAISVSESSTGVLTINNTGVTSAVAGTGISVSGATGAVTVTNTAPDQTVAIASGTGISVSGTYPNFTVTNTAPSSGGTVTSVTGTAPIASSGGNTPAISISQSNTTTDGYLSSTDWNTFNGKQPAGTYVNSVSATSPITSTGGVTPTIAMPAATGSVNGYLTSTDWTTFNNKSNTVGTVTSVGGTGTVNGLTLTGTVTSSGNLTLGGTLDLSSPPAIGNTAPNTVAGTVIQATNGIVVNSNTVSASYTIPSGSSAMSAGPMTVASGQTVTVSSGSRWVIL
jgi:hypothetical protein